MSWISECAALSHLFLQRTRVGPKFQLCEYFFQKNETPFLKWIRAFSPGGEMNNSCCSKSTMTDSNFFWFLKKKDRSQFSEGDLQVNQQPHFRQGTCRASSCFLSEEDGGRLQSLRRVVKFGNISCGKWEKELRKSPCKNFKKSWRILFSNSGPRAKMMDCCIDSGLRFVIWVRWRQPKVKGVEEFTRKQL